MASKSIGKQEHWQEEPAHLWQDGLEEWRLSMSVMCLSADYPPGHGQLFHGVLSAVG